jgi:hypothetical protein
LEFMSLARFEIVLHQPLGDGLRIAQRSPDFSGACL